MKLPLHTGGSHDRIIYDAAGMPIADATVYIGDTNAAGKRAAHIAHCVNTRDELVESLREMLLAFSDEPIRGVTKRAREALTRATGGAQREALRSVGQTLDRLVYRIGDWCDRYRRRQLVAQTVSDRRSVAPCAGAYRSHERDVSLSGAVDKLTTIDESNNNANPER